MFGCIGFRLSKAVPVLLFVGFIAVFNGVGDPVTIMPGQDRTEAQRPDLVRQPGLDQPFFVQYGRFLWNALHGSFGIGDRLAQPLGQHRVDRLRQIDGAMPRRDAMPSGCRVACRAIEEGWNGRG